MNRILMDIVFEFMIFLELTDDEEVDPDLAVQWMEVVSHELHKLTLTERQELVEYAKECAARERGAHEQSGRTGKSERAEVLATFEQNIFLMNELDD